MDDKNRLRNFIKPSLTFSVGFILDVPKLNINFI